MRKPRLITLICIVLFGMFFLTGCSFIHSYTYYELESEGFDTDYNLRRPSRGENYYLPVKDNRVILYADSTNNKYVTFTCFNDFTRDYSCGPLWFPVIPCFGLITGRSHQPLTTLYISISNSQNIEIDYDIKTMQVVAPDGKKYPVEKIEDPIRFCPFGAHLENEWYESLEIDLGEITIEDSITIHPVIQFDKDTILGFTALPFWI